MTWLSSSPSEARELAILPDYSARPVEGGSTRLTPIARQPAARAAWRAQALLPAIDRLKRCAAEQPQGCDPRQAQRRCHTKEKAFQDRVSQAWRVIRKGPPRTDPGWLAAFRKDHARPITQRDSEPSRHDDTRR